MILARVAVWVGMVLAMPALADPPARSIIPMPRPGAEAPVAVPAASGADAGAPVVTRIRSSELAPGTSLRPSFRPGHRDAPQLAAPDASAIAAAVSSAMAVEGQSEEPRRGLLALFGGPNRRDQPGVTAVRRSLRPYLRPVALRQVATAPSHTDPPAATAASGGLCGVPGITGERLARIPGRLNGCGIAEPVRISAINGITLTQRPTLNCQAARALQGWLTEDVVPEIGRRGGGVASVRVISSYSCRTRNNQPGARLSEHATGNAIDIAGFGLADGSEVTVLSDWGSGAEGRILRNLHAAACGRFGTVLGPNADRYHQDHFHVDAASYRGGAYCR